MMHSPTPYKTEQDRDSAVQNAEERAERAEQKLAQLETEIAELKTDQSSATRTAPNDPVATQDANDAIDQLRREPMMAHLLDALEAGQDIGHYGRLVFAIVAHHFLSQDVLLDWLQKDPDFGHDQALALHRQVSSRDYNPPRRERILAWQAQQDFPILPDPNDPDCGNLYRNLKFPQAVYEHIQEYQEEKLDSQADPHSASESSPAQRK